MLDLTLDRALLAWSVAAVVGLGCSTDPAPVGPPAAELRAMIDDHCESVAACACAAGVVEQGCADELTARWDERRAMAERMGLSYDAECFAALTAEVEEYACFWPGGASPLCASYCAVFHGEEEVGDACEGDAQASDCAQGLTCSEGTCADPCMVLSGRGQGEACAQPDFGLEFDDCAQGLTCSWETGTCQPQATEGQSCRGTTCAPGLVCDWQTDTCQLASVEGQACFDRPCAEDHYCEWVDEGSQVCRAYATEGQSCFDRPCAEDLWCSDGDVCRPPPSEGEPCLFGSICGTGLVCSAFDVGVCVAPPEAGAPCGAQGECATGAWCDTQEVPTGVCALAQPVGETCAGHRQCESNYCPNGFCWAAPLEGEDCTGSNVCAAGLVCNGTICEATTSRAPAVCSYPGW